MENVASSPPTVVDTTSSAAPTGGLAPAPVETKPQTAADRLAGVKAPAESPKAEVKAAEVEARRKYRLKVDGKETEYEFDDTEISTRLQKGLAAERRMQEAAAIKKADAEFRERVKKDPFAALSDPSFGLDLEALAEQRLAQKYQEALLPEQERRTLELQRQLEVRDAEIKAFHDERARVAQEALEQQVFQETEAAFEEALEVSGLPRTRETMYLMAKVARMNLDHNLDLTPKQIASEVKRQVSSIHQNAVRAMRGDALVQFLGADVVKEVLKMSVAKIRAGGTVANVPPPPEAPAAPSRKADGGLNVFEEDRVRPQRNMNTTAAFRQKTKWR